jgi:hypothetical protein
MAETTITGLPNATTPLDGTERVPMDQAGTTKDATTQDIANLAAGTDLSYTAATRTLASSTGADVALPVATTSAAGLMASADKAKLDGIEAGAQVNVGTDLSYTAASRLLASSTGADVTLPEATTALAGLQSAADKARIDQLGADDSPSFTGLTITGTAPVVIPHIHGSIAGDFYVHVRNTSGAPLAAGAAVYATGSVGDTDRITVSACDPSNAATMPAIGILQTTLVQNGDGDAVVLGELRPFNTGDYQIRDRLYVGAGGAMVATPPASGLVQAVGSVARVNSNTGTILVNTGAAMARVGFTGAYGDLSGRPTLGTAAAASTSDFAPAAQGVTNGNSHNHDGGDGAQIAYNSLSGLPGVVSTSSAGLQPARSFSTITYGATVALDFASLDAQYRTISLTGNLELTTSNLANGRTLVIRLVADANQRTFTFPTDWKFLGTKPANIAASKVGVLSITAFGTTNADVVAAYAVQS